MSVVSICNKALSRIGVRSKIESMTETSQEAVECNVFYESVRDEVLRAVDWPFAAKFVTLANTAESITEWEYEYSYPSDCLRVRYIADGTNRTPNAEERIAYTVGQKSDGSGRSILTDRYQAVLCYTARIEDVNQFTPDFESLIAWKLAAEIAMPLSVQPGVADRAMANYMRELEFAFAAALNEKQADAMPDSELYTARIS